jgi:hypothetical protein
VDVRARAGRIAVSRLGVVAVDRLGTHVEQVIGVAVAGVQAELADGNAPPGAKIDRIAGSDMPTGND